MVEKEQFTVHDVIAAGYTLEPMVCLFCGSNEVSYHQYVGDAYCGDCGTWQLEGELEPYVTKVVFRKFKDGSNAIIALFPEDLADLEGNMWSYMHIGQHAAASRDLISVTDGATPEEYADLKEELESIGYNLEVRQRITRQMDKVRLEQLWGES